LRCYLNLKEGLYNMNDDSDEYHELCMRAQDEQRELTDLELAIQADFYYEFLRDKYEPANP
jgi:hypothetical protein